MITGDNAKTAENVSSKLKIKKTMASALPKINLEKLKIFKKWKYCCICR